MPDITKEDILDLVLKSLSRGEEIIPDRPAVEAMTDNFLKAFGHLTEARKWIISQALAILVTSIGKAQELVDPNGYHEWLEKHDRSAWRSWPWLILYLKERLRRPKAVRVELERSSDRVLELIGDPRRDGLWDRRGMVVGHVQSGKTQHYTSVVAKAIDAGYKLVVILSGIHENLRQQTQERIEECITGKNSRNQFQPFGIRTFATQFKSTNNPDQPPPDISSLTSVAGDFSAAVKGTIDVALGAVPVVLVIKKNVSILRNLLKTLRGGNAPYTTQKCPTLIIDDEADHSSVNTAKVDPETDPTRINELIRKILWACDKVAFVGYTATPYANIFIDDNWVAKRDGRNIDEPGSDLFPRAFIIGLEAPSNYIGPDIVFGSEGDESLGLPPRAPLPMEQQVSDAETWLPAKHKSSHRVTGDIPKSLVEALNVFVLSIAARTAIGQNDLHCSMLIHVTRFNAVQAQVMAQVKAYLDGLYSELESGVKRDVIWDDLKEIWDRIFSRPFGVFFDHPSQKLDPPVLPDWVNVKKNVLASLARLKFASVNSETKEHLDFAGNSKQGLVVVAVGGDRLSRGLTLEGLTVSYFLRGARAYDTLMQMGRWFGYRPSYTHLCRVYAPSEITRNFRTITLATEELRREFSRMCYLKRTPIDYGLQVREPRADLLVTALNKMRRGETVRIHFAESLVSSLDIPEKALAGNLDAFKQLVEAIERINGASSTVEKVNHKWGNVDWDVVAPFLAAYTANSHVCLANDQGKSLLYTYINSVQKYGDLNKWTVVVVGKAKGTPFMDGKPFTLIGRQRLMKIPEAPTQPLHSNRVTFQGVAMGADEKLDLDPYKIDEAKHLKDQKQYQSFAAAFRAQRPSSNGLLLLYPIIPTIPDGSTAKEWDGPPVIGIAVSLPSSKHDTGCDYVCTPQKMRELFGSLADDLKRDEEEDQSPTP